MRYFRKEYEGVIDYFTYTEEEYQMRLTSLNTTKPILPHIQFKELKITEITEEEWKKSQL